MFPKTKTSWAEVGTMGRPWPFASLADYAIVKFFIGEASDLITVTEPCDIHTVSSL